MKLKEVGCGVGTTSPAANVGRYRRHVGKTPEGLLMVGSADGTDDDDDVFVDSVTVLKVNTIRWQ